MECTILDTNNVKQIHISIRRPISKTSQWFKNTFRRRRSNNKDCTRLDDLSTKTAQRLTLHIDHRFITKHASNGENESENLKDIGDENKGDYSSVCAAALMTYYCLIIKSVGIKHKQTTIFV